MSALSYRTAGESHGQALITLVEGLPAGLGVDLDTINCELRRRQGGHGRGGRMKLEQDEVEVLSGVRRGATNRVADRDADPQSRLSASTRRRRSTVRGRDTRTWPVASNG